MTIRGAFIPADNIALFLDVDGTLLEIASTPDSVTVPATLRNTLRLSASREGGALALISGRSLVELDRLFSPCLFPAAGQHGLERRNARGVVTRPAIEVGPLVPVRNALTHLQHQYSGLLLEDKGTALAIHYRLAPQCETVVRKVMAESAAPLQGQFVLRFGKCVIELAPAGFSKRQAIEAFMAEAPFAGRIPVFVGDDITDEDGFEAVNALSGYSIRVGADSPSVARHRFASVAAVIAWLRERNVTLRRSTL